MKRKVHSVSQFYGVTNEICCLVDKESKMSTEGTIENELLFPCSVLAQSGYPERFTNKTTGKPELRRKERGPTRKAVYVCLPFKYGTEAGIIQRRLTGPIGKTFFAEQLRIVITSKLTMCFQLKDRLSAHASLFCVYSSTCFCEIRYFDSSTLFLSDRVRKHPHAYLSTRTVNESDR